MHDEVCDERISSAIAGAVRQFPGAPLAAWTLLASLASPLLDAIAVHFSAGSSDEKRDEQLVQRIVRCIAANAQWGNDCALFADATHSGYCDPAKLSVGGANVARVVLASPFASRDERLCHFAGSVVALARQRQERFAQAQPTSNATFDRVVVPAGAPAEPPAPSRPKRERGGATPAPVADVLLALVETCAARTLPSATTAASAAGDGAAANGGVTAPHLTAGAAGATLSSVGWRYGRGAVSLALATVVLDRAGAVTHVVRHEDGVVVEASSGRTAFVEEGL